MDVASVTLDEVLRAAARRAAALVPETAGYLALAIGDASARLPYRLDDELVTLTTEGTVRVARGRVTVPPEESARLLRDLLRRLLSVSAGSMPGLAQAAGPRPEVAPDAVVAAVEAALIPVNRAAARRSLARLARDTARARDAGRLAGGAPAPAAAAAPAPPTAASAPPMTAPRLARAIPTAAAAPAPAVEPAYEEPEVIVTTPSVPIVVVAATDDDPRVGAWTDGPAHLDEEPAMPFRPELAVARRPATPAPEEVTHRLALPVDAPAEEALAAVVVDGPRAANAADDPHAEQDTTGVESAADATTIDPDVVAVAENLDVPVVESEPPFGVELLPVHEPAVEDEHAVVAELAVAAEHAVEDEPVVADEPAVADEPVVAAEHAVADEPAVAAEPAVADEPAVAAAPVPHVEPMERATRALEDALRRGALAAATVPVRSAPTVPARRSWQAELAPAAQSDVDSLLARFGTSEVARDATAMRRDLKHLVGIDATQLPPRVGERAR